MKRRTLRQIPVALRNVDAAKAAQLADDDFPQFCQLVVAEATARVRPEVTEMLDSPKWHRAWSDALLCAVDTAETAMAWARYDRKPDRLALQKQRFHALQTRLGYVNGQMRAARMPQPTTDPDFAARAWLARLVCPGLEMGERIRTELRAHGMDPNRYYDPADRDTTIAWGVENGWLRPKRDSDVEELLAMDDSEFADVVLEDVEEWEERDAGLRMLLVLDRWGHALRDLRVATLRREGLPVPPGRGLPEVPAGAYSWPEDDFSTLIRTRRFVAGINQRIAEQQRRHVEARLLIDQRRMDDAAYTAVKDVAFSRVVAEYPAVFAAIRRVLDPYVTEAGVLGALYLADPRAVKARAVEAGRAALEASAQGCVA